MVFDLKMKQVEGIRKGYPLLRKRLGKLAAYIQLLRVFTLIAPLFAGILGVLSTTSFSFESFTAAVYVGVTLALAQATGQVINQYADLELDKMVKKYRPLPSGLISREEALGIAWLLALFGITRAFTITTVFGLVVVALIFFAVFYSLSPFSPRKIHPFLNVAWMAVSRGFIPVLAVWSIYGEWVNALPYALIGFFWVLGFQGAKDVEDVKGDWIFGIKTVVGRYGVIGLRTLMVTCGFIIISICAFFQLHLMGVLPVIGGFAIYGLTKKSKFTENNYGWVGMYIGLALFYVLMFLTERSSFP